MELSTDIWRWTICRVPSRNACRDDSIQTSWQLAGQYWVDNCYHQQWGCCWWNCWLLVSHLGKTKYAHEVTAAALSVVMNRAYQEYVSSTPVDEVKEISAWCEDQMAKHPKLQYWSMVLNLGLLVLNLVGSIRSGDFQQYMKSIQDLIPWSFAMDHINYSRSLSIHLRDMTSPSTLHPSVYTHFSEGRFVAHRTTRSFSGMALDQAHEQLNALVKGEGGAVGLTENAAALSRWMFAGPEISRMIQEFEGFSQQPESEHHTKCHSTGFFQAGCWEPNWCHPWSWESLLGRQWWLDHFGHQRYHGAVF